MEPNHADRGWVEVSNLLSPDECLAIVTACREICADTEDSHPRDKPVAGTVHLEALDERVELVSDMLERAPLLDAVADWFETEVVPAPMQVSLRSPNPGFGAQDLHRDAIEGPPQGVPNVVTAIVALTDFAENNGATRIVPGSHRTGQPAAAFRGRRRSPEETTLIGEAGRAFVFDGHVLHGGGENRSPTPRPALQIVWRS